MFPLVMTMYTQLAGAGSNKLSKVIHKMVQILLLFIKTQKKGKNTLKNIQSPPTSCIPSLESSHNNKNWM